MLSGVVWARLCLDGIGNILGASNEVKLDATQACWQVLGVSLDLRRMMQRRPTRKLAANIFVDSDSGGVPVLLADDGMEKVRGEPWTKDEPDGSKAVPKVDPQKMEQVKGAE